MRLQLVICTSGGTDPDKKAESVSPVDDGGEDQPRQSAKGRQAQRKKENQKK